MQWLNNKTKVMVKQCKVFVLMATLWLSVSSCSEEEGGKVAADGSIIARVDGVDWETDVAAAGLISGQITITGIGNDGSSLVLHAASATTGTFPLSGSLISIDHSISFIPPESDINNPLYISSHLNESNIGEIRITEFDDVNKTVSGTFHSKVMRFLPEEAIIEIKSGSFTKVPYEEELSSVPDNTFSAKVNGVTFPPLMVSGVSSFGRIVLSVSSSGGKGIAINVPDDTNTGTFSLGTMGEEYYATYNEGTTMYESVSGSIAITKHDKTNDRIEGTFNFTGQLFPLGGGSLSVTEGSFAISY